VLGGDAYNCIIDHENFDQTMHHLKQYLLTGERDYALDLAETMRKNALEYFADALDSLFDEKYSEWEYESNLSSGLKPMRYKDNNELRWY
jgi:translation initiation factor 2B subunit (eIF-2B alpha/beta/delta family)